MQVNLGGPIGCCRYCCVLWIYGFKNKASVHPEKQKHRKNNLLNICIYSYVYQCHSPYMWVFLHTVSSLPALKTGLRLGNQRLTGVLPLAP